MKNTFKKTVLATSIALASAGAMAQSSDAYMSFNNIASFESQFTNVVKQYNASNFSNRNQLVHVTATSCSGGCYEYLIDGGYPMMTKDFNVVVEAIKYFYSANITEIKTFSIDEINKTITINGYQYTSGDITTGLYRFKFGTENKTLIEVMAASAGRQADGAYIKVNADGTATVYNATQADAWRIAKAKQLASTPNSGHSYTVVNNQEFVIYAGRSGTMYFVNAS